MKISSNNLPALLKDYQTLELRSHVSIDDIISKVTQEVAELMEAYDAMEMDESYKEAADVIVNILSISSRLGALPADFDNPSDSTEDDTFPEEKELLQMLGKWNQTIQAFRGRYSRQQATAQDLSSITRSFVSAILLYTSKEQTLDGIVQGNTTKLRNRIDAYGNGIVLSDYIRAFENFPKPGIMFRDISPLLANPEAMRYAAFEMAIACQDADVIAGLDARGFLFGMAIAEILGKPFVMIRKKGKLPGRTVGTDYSLEYGDSSIEIQADAIRPGQKVALVDDLLATGGTLAAASSLVERAGGVVNNISCVISLDEPSLCDQGARKMLMEKYSVECLLGYK